MSTYRPQILEAKRLATAELRASHNPLIDEDRAVEHCIAVFTQLVQIHRGYAETPKEAYDKARLDLRDVLEQVYPVRQISGILARAVLTYKLEATAALVNQRISNREERLQEFVRKRECSITDVSRSANVHKPDMQRWRSGDPKKRLPDTSAISSRIEKVLAGTSPLKITKSDN